MWDLSCRDWEDRIRRGRSLIPDLPLFEAEAEIAVEFFDKLRLPDVPGTPTMAESCGDWFREIVAALFGSRDPSTNERFIEEVFALIAKKNSKTTYGAGLMLTALFMNLRPRGEFLFVGPTQAIADLAFSQCSGMVNLDTELLKRFKPVEHKKEIQDRVNGSKLRIKTFDLDILTGPRPVGVLLDELHLLGKNAAASKVLRQLRGGRESNPEGFLLITTTQSDEPPAGAFSDELKVARAIRDGRASGRMLPILYEFPDAIARNQDAWADVANWPMVMPNLGRSLRLDSLARNFETERSKGEAAIRIWASQHLNIQIGLGLQQDRWPGAEFWERQAESDLTKDALLARSEVVVIGIDGGGLDDLFGLALLGRDRETKHWLLWSHAWCHRGVLDRRKSIASKLEGFAEAQELTIVDDSLDDLSQIVAIVSEVQERGLLACVAVDPAGLGEFVDAMAALDVTVENKTLVGVGQGYRMMNAIKTTERKLANGTFWHGGSGLMAWCVGNLKIEPTATAIRATKLNAGDAKIDPVMAAFDAADQMQLNPATVEPMSMIV